MQIFDEDSANIAHAENKQVQQYEQEQKNIILKMTPGVRKQKMWNHLFPKPTYSEEINSMVF